MTDDGACIGSYHKNLQYDGIGEQKTYDCKRNVWVRAKDCLVAEKVFGYKWFPVSQKTDFCGNKFYLVLTTDAPDQRYVLEPDTRVPNFSTDYDLTHRIALAAGLESIPILPTRKQTAARVCELALAGVA